MTADEADQFIWRCHRVLPGWQRKIDAPHGDAKADAQAARDSVLGTLMEVADDFPDKRETADSIAKQYNLVSGRPRSNTDKYPGATAFG